MERIIAISERAKLVDFGHYCALFTHGARNYDGVYTSDWHALYEYSGDYVRYVPTGFCRYVGKKNIKAFMLEDFQNESED